MRFRLLEQLRLSTINGDRGDVRGETVRASQELTVVGGVVMARLILSAGSKNLDTTVQVTPGRQVVLGQSGWKDGEDDSVLLYVIRADLHDAPAAR